MRSHEFIGLMCKSYFIVRSADFMASAITQLSEQPAASPAVPSAVQLLRCWVGGKVMKWLLSFLQISKCPKRENPLTKAATFIFPQTWNTVPAYIPSRCDALIFRCKQRNRQMYPDLHTTTWTDSARENDCQPPQKHCCKKPTLFYSGDPLVTSICVHTVSSFTCCLYCSPIPSFSAQFKIKPPLST